MSFSLIVYNSICMSFMSYIEYWCQAEPVSRTKLAAPTGAPSSNQRRATSSS